MRKVHIYISIVFELKIVVEENTCFIFLLRNISLHYTEMRRIHIYISIIFE
jgi:hypothetical protein